MPTLEDLAALWDVPCKGAKEQLKSDEGVAQKISSEFRATVARYLSQKRKLSSKRRMLREFLSDSEDSDADESVSPRDTERILRRFPEEQELSEDSDSEDSDSDSRPPKKQALSAEAQVRERSLLSDSDDSDADESDSPLDTSAGLLLCFW
ncbi:zinc finger CCHC domain-containing protein 10-like [Penaeus monodon]|uniref:zinc finger CCHC domain-containing protein 10-like n=1 Tax=Penaeus monodon TaxID=6687 RepID=UPI0018A78C16|nr:zinc finger CCHC domain-containing protein 10-like [Penaeus monodon]